MLREPFFFVPVRSGCGEPGPTSGRDRFFVRDDARSACRAGRRLAGDGFAEATVVRAAIACLPDREFADSSHARLAAIGNGSLSGGAGSAGDSYARLATNGSRPSSVGRDGSELRPACSEVRPFGVARCDSLGRLRQAAPFRSCDARGISGIGYGRRIVRFCASKAVCAGGSYGGSCRARAFRRRAECFGFGMCRALRSVCRSVGAQPGGRRPGVGRRRVRSGPSSCLLSGRMPVWPPRTLF